MRYGTGWQVKGQSCISWWRWNGSEYIGDGCIMEYVKRINRGLNNMMGI